MTTRTKCEPADHHFLAQEAMPNDLIPLEIGYLRS